MLNGVLCVFGQLHPLQPEKSDIKHSVILPKPNNVADLIIRCYHQLSGHLGKEYVLSLIRERFWMVNARASVSSLNHQSAFRMQKASPTAYAREMPDLLQSRIIPGEPPFTYVDVDNFRPFYEERARSRVKRYGVIVSCLIIRAVHFEMSHSLDTDSFINVLRRFMARRGRPKEIRSGIGTNFTSAESELKNSSVGS